MNLSNLNPFRRAVKNVAIGELDEFLRWKMTTKHGVSSNAGITELRRAVPWLFRSVDLIAQSIHDYPFDIVNDTGEVVDSSTDWQDKLDFTQNIFDLLYKVSASLTLRGKSYVYPARNRIVIKELRYWVADTVTPIISEDKGLERFERRVGANKVEYVVTEQEPYPLLYFWLNDPDVEIGEPLAYPAQAAINAAGVLFSLDKFFGEHADRGLIKAYIAAVKGIPPVGSPEGKAAKDRLEDDLTRTLTGSKNTGRIKVINADTVELVSVGDGLKELENVTLTKEKREDISTAIGVPGTMLWSSEASGLGGGGVTKEDTYRFYKQTICPNFNFIASILNQQLFKPLGYRIVGNPETLDVFQEDEAQRSAALESITSALNTDLTIAKFTMDLLGYDLSDDQEKELDALISAKEDRAAQMSELAKQAANKPADNAPANGGDTGNMPPQPAAAQQAKPDENAQAKAIEAGQYKRFIAKHPDKVDAFTFHYLDAGEQAALKSGGAGSANADDPFPSGAQKSVDSVASKFQQLLTMLVQEAWQPGSDALIKTDMRLIVRRYTEDAYFEGMLDNGGTPDQLADTDRERIDALIAEQEQYITKFSQDVKDAKGDPLQQASILKRVELWAESVAHAGESGRTAASATRQELLQWHTANDELEGQGGILCKICAPLNNKIVVAGESFGEDADGNPIYSPPVHAHCRCQTSTYIED
jgi:hypothetical protein